jgi:drug/metabolite transporter (DMT)-like permease
MSWQLLTAISVFTLSASVILQRILLSKDKIDLYAYAVVFQAIVGAMLMIFAVGFGFKLPNIENLLLPAIVSILAFGGGHIMYAKTLQVVEASAFSVLFATQAVWIMIFGILLFNESLTILQVFGVILIFSSVGLLVKNFRSFKIDTGTVSGLLTGALFGVAITCWSYVGRYTDGLSWAAISFIGTAVVAYLIRPKSVHKMRALLEPAVLRKLLLLGVFYAIGSLTMLFAYKVGAFSTVTPLRQTSIVITVLLALLLITNERNRIVLKLISALVCFIGVVLIVIA